MPGRRNALACSRKVMPILLLICILGFASCRDEISVVSIGCTPQFRPISAPTFTLKVGQSVQASASAHPPQGCPPGPNVAIVEWTTDPSILALQPVNDTMVVVTGIKAGQAALTAQAKNPADVDNTKTGMTFTVEP